MLFLPSDLVPREVAEAWLSYLREELPTVAFKCSTQKQVRLQRHSPWPVLPLMPAAKLLHASAHAMGGSAHFLHFLPCLPREDKAG